MIFDGNVEIESQVHVMMQGFVGLHDMCDILLFYMFVFMFQCCIFYPDFDLNVVTFNWYVFIVFCNTDTVPVMLYNSFTCKQIARRLSLMLKVDSHSIFVKKI